MAVTQKSYVDSNSSVKAARKKLDKAKAELADAKKAKAGLPPSAGNQLTSQANDRLSSAQAAVDTAKAEADAVEAKAIEYFSKNEEKITAKSVAKDKAKAESGITAGEEQIARMKQAGLDTSQLEQQVAKAKEKLTKPAGSTETPTGETPGAKIKPDDFAGLLKNARKDIKNLSNSERLDLANKLISIGIVVPKSGEFTDALVQGYSQLVGAAQGYYKANKEFPTVDSYLAEQQRQYAITGTSGGAQPYGQIFDKTAAAAKVNEVVKSVLNRDATAAEVADLSQKLIKAQTDHPYKTVNGRTVGGIDVGQFLTDILQKSDEYKSKKQAKQDLTTQSIESTARANGIKLSESQLQSYSDRVKNGEDIKTIQAQIRSTAGLGQPDSIKKMLADGNDLDTIYDPYRRVMATSLGVAPDSITLDDPTLRMAIGPEKEMSLYDFKKAIRQDNRWKYSQEANDEVTNMVNQVKRDFGFMG